MNIIVTKLQRVLYSNIVGCITGFIIGFCSGVVYLYSLGIALGMRTSDFSFTFIDALEASLVGLVFSLGIGFPLGWIIRKICKILITHRNTEDFTDK